MRQVLFFLTLLLSLNSLLAQAEVGKTLWIRDSAKPGTWRAGDNVCLYQGPILTGCGAIKETRLGSLGIVLNEQMKEVQANRAIRIVRDQRTPVTTKEVSSKMQTSNAKNFNIGLGITAGTKYYYPHAHFQLALNRNWSLGVMPMYASYSQDTDEITAYGAFLTLTYYYTHFAFKGVQFEAGVGMDSITIRTGLLEEKHSPIVGKFTVGWAGKALWDLGLDIGVAAGAQYVGFTADTLDTTFRGFLPLVSAYVAYPF